MKKKWSKAEMKKHGWRIFYYGGYHVDLAVPKGLSEDNHYSYIYQKVAYINSLCKSQRKAKK